MPNRRTPIEEAMLLEKRQHDLILKFTRSKRLAEGLSTELALRTCELMMGENESMKQLMVVHGNELAMFTIGERIEHLEKVWSILDERLKKFT